MKMSLSSLLRWGGKRKAPDERRDEGRYVAEGPMKAYWVADGACVVARGELRDLSEDGSGLGFRLRREMPVGRSGWVVTHDGQTLSGIVRHCDAQDGFSRIGVQMKLRSEIHEGWGGVRVRWIDAADAIHDAAASLRNGPEGVLEVNCAGEPPVESLVEIVSAQYSCLCFVRASKAYGKRYLLEVETVSEAVKTAQADAA